MSVIDHHCGYCNHYFKFRDIYERHILMCEFMHKPKVQRDRDAENSETPISPKEMHYLLREMMQEIKTLRQKVAKLETSARSKKTRIISQWLNDNPHTRPSANLLDWTSQFMVDKKCLDMIYQENIYDAVQFCIKRELEAFKTDNAPIRAFTQKPNTIYVYTSDDAQLNTWKILSYTELERWISHITHRFLVEFTKIQSENLEEIYNNRKEEEKHNIMMLKINGRQIPPHEFKKWLFPKIETNIQTLMEYEFV